MLWFATIHLYLITYSAYIHCYCPYLQTVMVANLHSSAYYFNLTRTTLEYATWAANTHNIVKENIVSIQSLAADQVDVEAQKIRYVFGYVYV